MRKQINAVKSISLFLCFLLCFTLFTNMLSVKASESTSIFQEGILPPQLITDRFIVKFKNDDKKDKKEKSIKDKYQDKVKDSKKLKIKGMDFEIIKTKEKMRPKDFIDEVMSKDRGEIVYIQPDYELMIESIDPLIQVQWGIHNTETDTLETKREGLDREYRDGMIIEEEYNLRLKMLPREESEMLAPKYRVDVNVKEAWDVSQGEGVTVAIIDTGIDTTHEDIKENIWINTNEIPRNGIDDDGNGYIDDINGWNFFGNSNILYSQPTDAQYEYYDGHGTHIAGIIGAAKDNGLGISGVAPKVKLMPLKVFENGKASTSGILDAISYAEKMGVKIVNCSWGTIDNNPALEEVIKSSNMLFICAAGNSHINIDKIPKYPASIDSDNVISVASISKNGFLSSFSSYGEKSVDVAAPGDNIYSAIPDNQYGFKNGTSMATAFVTGEAALLLSMNNNLSNKEIRQKITETSDKYSSLIGKTNGGNKINCGNAVNGIINNELVDIIGSENVNIENIPIISNKQSEIELYSTGFTTTPMVSITGEHCLYLDANGKVWSWGNNANGQLGDGTRTDRFEPIRVKGLTDVIAVSAGAYHSLALKSDGTVWSWGNNNSGQLGDGTTTDRHRPAQIQGLNNIISIEGGGYYSLALRADGTVCAWGDNAYGQLGDGTKINKSLPNQIQQLSNIKSISSNWSHALALKTDGTVCAWGYNGYGQLGDGTTNSTSSPILVRNISSVKEISTGGNHSLALKTDGTVWAWGSNCIGQLGDGSYDDCYAPKMIEGLPNMKKIGCGEGSSLGISSEGEVFVWGSNECKNILPTSEIEILYPTKLEDINNAICIDGSYGNTVILTDDYSVYTIGANYCGQLGDGSIPNKPIFSKVNVIGKVKKVSINSHTLCMDENYKLWAWGNNTYGQLGDGTNNNSYLPIQINAITGTTEETEINAGSYQSTVLLEDGMWSWGYNGSGQLGDGTVINKSSPAQISSSGYIDVTTNGSHAMALDSSGYVWSWGNNSYGQLGDGTTTTRLTPVKVQGLTNVIAITTGTYHSLALKSDGTVWSWGANQQGQIGDGTTATRLTPVKVQGLTNVIAITTGTQHSLALKSDGTVWSWGSNGSGQLGDGTTTRRLTPVKVQGLSNVVTISAGSYHSLALKSDGTVLSWGSNYKGQLGDNSYTDKLVPTIIYGIPKASHIIAGYHNSGIIDEQGYLYTCGDNNSSQLGGVKYTVDSGTPVKISFNIARHIQAQNQIASGSNHHLYLNNDGKVYSWGNNNYGQIGDGTLINRAALVELGLAEIKIVDCGNFFSAAVDEDGFVWTWGYNWSSSLGDGTDIDKKLPDKINISGVKDISCGDFRCLALMEDGTVYEWGNYQFDVLGDENSSLRTVPTKVNGLDNVVKVACGENHNLALKEDGTVWAWGANFCGQLGNGDNMPSIIPVQTEDIVDAIDIAAGSNHSIAVRSNGEVYSWGENSNGQLGDGTFTTRNSPVFVCGSWETRAISCKGNHSIITKEDNSIWECGYSYRGYEEELYLSVITKNLNQINKINVLSDVKFIYAGRNNAILLKNDGSVWTFGDKRGYMRGGFIEEEVTPTQINIPRIPSYKELNVNCIKNKNILLSLTSTNVCYSDIYEYTISYNPNELELVDLCAITPEIELSEGQIANTSITVKSFILGEIVLLVDTYVPDNKLKTKVDNIIKFKSKIDGNTVVKYIKI